MAARDLRNSSVRGIEGRIGTAIARALTKEFFFTLKRRDRPRKVILYYQGVEQARFDDERKYWIITGQKWGSERLITRRILDWTFNQMQNKVLQDRKIIRNMTFDALHRAYESTTAFFGQPPTEESTKKSEPIAKKRKTPKRKHAMA